MVKSFIQLLEDDDSAYWNFQQNMGREDPKELFSPEWLYPPHQPEGKEPTARLDPATKVLRDKLNAVFSSELFNQIPCGTESSRPKQYWLNPTLKTLQHIAQIKDAVRVIIFNFQGSYNLIAWHIYPYHENMRRGLESIGSSARTKDSLEGYFYGGFYSSEGKFSYYDRWFYSPLDLSNGALQWALSCYPSIQHIGNNGEQYNSDFI
jgi:hypothetical protein